MPNNKKEVSMYKYSKNYNPSQLYTPTAGQDWLAGSEASQDIAVSDKNERLLQKWIKM